MSMLSVRRIKVAADKGAADGLVVLNDSVLVAVLMCLDETFYEADMGRWHLEAGFGRCDGSSQTFDDVETALGWVAKRLGLDQESAMRAATDFKAGL